MAAKMKRILFNENILRDLWDDIKHKIGIVGVPEGEKIEQGTEDLFEEIMTENFPNLVKEKITQVQEVQSLT